MSFTRNYESSIQFHYSYPNHFHRMHDKIIHIAYYHPDRQNCYPHSTLSTVSLAGFINSKVKQLDVQGIRKLGNCDVTIIYPKLGNPLTNALNSVQKLNCSFLNKRNAMNQPCCHKGNKKMRRPPKLDIENLLRSMPVLYSPL